MGFLDKLLGSPPPPRTPKSQEVSHASDINEAGDEFSEIDKMDEGEFEDEDNSEFEDESLGKAFDWNKYLPDEEDEEEIEVPPTIVISQIVPCERDICKPTVCRKGAICQHSKNVVTDQSICGNRCKCILDGTKDCICAMDDTALKRKMKGYLDDLKEKRFNQLENLTISQIDNTIDIPVTEINYDLLTKEIRTTSRVPGGRKNTEVVVQEVGITNQSTATFDGKQFRSYTIEGNFFINRVPCARAVTDDLTTLPESIVRDDIFLVERNFVVNIGSQAGDDESFKINLSLESDDLDIDEGKSTDSKKKKKKKKDEPDEILVQPEKMDEKPLENLEGKLPENLEGEKFEEKFEEKPPENLDEKLREEPKKKEEIKPLPLNNIRKLSKEKSKEDKFQKRLETRLKRKALKEKYEKEKQEKLEKARLLDKEDQENENIQKEKEEVEKLEKEMFEKVKAEEAALNEVATKTKIEEIKIQERKIEEPKIQNQKIEEAKIEAPKPDIREDKMKRMMEAKKRRMERMKAREQAKASAVQPKEETKPEDEKLVIDKSPETLDKMITALRKSLEKSEGVRRSVEERISKIKATENELAALRDSVRKSQDLGTIQAIEEKKSAEEQSSEATTFSRSEGPVVRSGRGSKESDRRSSKSKFRQMELIKSETETETTTYSTSRS